MTDWQYASRKTLDGALQRGLGRGALLAPGDPSAAGLVAACLHHDYRWDRQVDERAVYLARLIRDLDLPAGSLTDDRFAGVLPVHEALGRAGRDDVVAGVRRYIAEGGEHWQEALETVAATWPAAWWEDLRPAVVDRIDPGGPGLFGAPWESWLGPRPLVAAPRRPFAETPDLLPLLRDPARSADWRPVLRELRRRPPQPELLELVDQLLAAGVGHPLAAAVRELGPVAVPAARTWARTPPHPLYWTALRLLAEHGTETDIPALVAGLDWLDSREGDLCGYDDLMTGLARIGGPAATAEARRLRRLWSSPHTYERPAYLRALLVLDPDRAQRAVAEGLWDCESRVRLIAAEQTPLTETTRARLRYLRDDPIETTDVREAAAHRLPGR